MHRGAAVFPLKVHVSRERTAHMFPDTLTARMFPETLTAQMFPETLTAQMFPETVTAQMKIFLQLFTR